MIEFDDEKKIDDDTATTTQDNDDEHGQTMVDEVESVHSRFAPDSLPQFSDTAKPVKLTAVDVIRGMSRVDVVMDRVNLAKAEECMRDEIPITVIGVDSPLFVKSIRMRSAVGVAECTTKI